MSAPSFTPPAEVAQINRIHYELEYTEGISQRMRIPETLKVAPESGTGPIPVQAPPLLHTTLMQVPERIVVAGLHHLSIKCFSIISGGGRNGRKEMSFNSVFCFQAMKENPGLFNPETWILSSRFRLWTS